MSNNGLHKLYGASYTRIQPALCGFCKYYRPNVNKLGWSECDAKHKLLSNPHVIEGKCKDYAYGGQRETDEVIAQWKQEAQEHQVLRKKIKARGTLSERIEKSITRAALPASQSEGGAE